jgi:hypothetical protein
MTMLYLMTSPEAVPVQIENALGSLLNSGPDDAHRQQGMLPPAEPTSGRRFLERDPDDIPGSKF